MKKLVLVCAIVFAVSFATKADQLLVGTLQVTEISPTNVELRCPPSPNGVCYKIIGGQLHYDGKVYDKALAVGPAGDVTDLRDVDERTVVDHIILALED